MNSLSQIHRDLMVQQDILKKISRGLKEPSPAWRELLTELGHTPITSTEWDGIFADPEVGRVLYANGLIADANKSSIEELATITSLNPTNYYNGSYFYDNKVITQFPELKYCIGLTRLDYVFYSCTNLSTVLIPSSVTSLDSTFQSCSSLITAPVIPEGVTNLSNTFYGCSSLTTATIPSSVTSLDNTFYSCSSLITAPVIPEGVTDLSSTFVHCTSLTTATIPSSVTRLYGTFVNCSSLITAPVIPEGVTDLSFTFMNCSNINGIYIINAVNPPTYDNGLFNAQAIYVPDASVDAYKSASGWSEFADKIYPMSNKPQ